MGQPVSLISSGWVFYLAAKYEWRRSLLPIAALLTMAGHEVKAEWIGGGHEEEGEMDHETKKRWANQDLIDIGNCNIFALFNLPVEAPEPSTGRFIELGYALAKGKRVVFVGGGQGIFTTLVEFYPEIEDFLAVYAPGMRL